MTPMRPVALCSAIVALFAFSALPLLAQAPANDACISAEVIAGDGQYSGTLIDATNDGTADCGSSGSNPDVWYYYTAAADGQLKIDTCGSNTLSGIDTVISLHSSCPGGTGVQLECNDDHGGLPCSTGGASLDSAIHYDLLLGEFVYIRVSKFGGTGVQPFLLNVEHVTTLPGGPPNDDCADAEVISGDGQYPGTLVDATNDGSASCGGSGTNPDVWYVYTAPYDGLLHVNACGSVIHSGIDPVLSAHTACPGTTSNQIQCNDDYGGGADQDACDGIGSGYDSALAFYVFGGETVYIRFSKYGGGGLYPFLLNLELESDCAPFGSGACTAHHADVTVSWDLQDIYDEIQISRDDVGLLATIPGHLVGYIDSNVPAGTYLYTVVGYCGGAATAPLECSITHTPPTGPQFIRTDCNNDGAKNLTDAVYLLQALFPVSPPAPTLDCQKACDCSDDGQLSIVDPVCILFSLFGTPPTIPAAPFEACGVDLTTDALTCVTFGACP